MNTITDIDGVRRRNLDREHGLTRFFNHVEVIEAAQREIAELLEESNDPLVLPERRCIVHAEVLRLRAIVKSGGVR